MELWKSVFGFDGIYEVSNLGRIRSLDRTIYPKRGKPYFVKGSVLKPQKRLDYSGVCLSNGKPYRVKLLHRIVAMAWIPNPENKPQVNHKNGNKRDNRVENLEWCTVSENSIHAIRTGLQKILPKGKGLFQYDEAGNQVAKYLSVLEAVRKTGLTKDQLYKYLAGTTTKQPGGYMWKWQNPELYNRKSA